MHRKLLTLLVSACALAAVMAGPAAASAATLTLNNSLGAQASEAYFEAESTTVTTSLGSYQCDEFTFGAQITQNQSDPVTLQQSNTRGTPNVDGCQTSSGVNIDYSNVQLNGPMELNADGTGTLPLRVTETWGGQYTCVRQGVLNLTYTGNRNLNFDGYLTKTTGSWVCPASARWQGWFEAPTGDGIGPMDWVFTP